MEADSGKEWYWVNINMNWLFLLIVPVLQMHTPMAPPFLSPFPFRLAVMTSAWSISCRIMTDWVNGPQPRPGPSTPLNQPLISRKCLPSQLLLQISAGRADLCSENKVHFPQSKLKCHCELLCLSVTIC